MELGDLLSLIALASSIAALFLAWLERSSSLRVSVYTKQLEACVEIYKAACRLDEELFAWSFERSDKHYSNETAEEIQNTLRVLLYTIENHTLILPESIFIETQNIKATLEADYKLMKANNSWAFKAKERENMLLNYEEKVRKHFGIERLTKQYKGIASVE